MNNVSQISVFDYSEIEILGDLERLKLFMENEKKLRLYPTFKETKKWHTHKAIKRWLQKNVIDERSGVTHLVLLSTFHDRVNDTDDFLLNVSEYDVVVLAFGSFLVVVFSEG